MDTDSSTLSDEYQIGGFHFLQNEGRFLRLPSAPGMPTTGFLVRRRDAEDPAQIRILDPSSHRQAERVLPIWKTIQEGNSSPLFPRIYQTGIDDECPFYISSIPGGKPVKDHDGNLDLKTAASVLLRFIGALKSQSVLPVDRFRLFDQSIWITNEDNRTELVLGDISPVECTGAESENVDLCLGLLDSLTNGESRNAFRRLYFDSPEKTFAQVETELDAFVEASRGLPKKTSIRHSLISLTTVSLAFACFVGMKAQAKPGTTLLPLPQAKKIHIPRQTKKLPKLNSNDGIEVDQGMAFESDFFLLLPAARKHLSGMNFPDGTVYPTVYGTVSPSGRHTVPSSFPKSAKRPNLEGYRDLVRKAEAHRARQDHFAAVKYDLAALSLRPKSKAIAEQIDLDLDHWQSAARYPLILEEVELLRQVGTRNQTALEMLAEHFQSLGDTRGELQVLLEHGEIPSTSPSTRRKLAARIFELPGVTELNRSLGFQWVRQAADQGDTVAQFLAGKCLLAGIGIPRDPATAVYYLKKAVTGNEPEAMDLLGICYLREWGVRKNATKAVELFRKSIEAGNATAYYNLGTSYALGEGVKICPQSAADVFKEGALKGNAHCMLAYARCFERAFGRKEDSNQAAAWYRESAINGNQEAIEWCEANGIELSDDLAAR